MDKMICSHCHRPIPDPCQPHYDPDTRLPVCTPCVAEDFTKRTVPRGYIKPLDAYGPSGDVGKVDVKENSSPRPDLEDMKQAIEDFSSNKDVLKLPKYDPLIDRLYAHVGEW